MVVDNKYHFPLIHKMNQNQDFVLEKEIDSLLIFQVSETIKLI